MNMIIIISETLLIIALLLLFYIYSKTHNNIFLIGGISKYLLALLVPLQLISFNIPMKSIITLITTTTIYQTPMILLLIIGTLGNYLYGILLIHLLYKTKHYKSTVIVAFLLSYTPFLLFTQFDTLQYLYGLTSIISVSIVINWYRCQDRCKNDPFECED